MACLSRLPQTAPVAEGLNFSDDWLATPRSTCISPYSWTVGTPAEFLWFTSDTGFPESIAHPFVLPLEYYHGAGPTQQPEADGAEYFGYTALKNSQCDRDAPTRDKHGTDSTHALSAGHNADALSSSAGRPTHLGWGSDVNFGPARGYKPAASKLTVDSMHQDQMDWAGMMYEKSNTAASVPASSPPPRPSNFDARRNSLPTYRFRSFQQKDMQRHSLTGPLAKRGKGRTSTGSDRTGSSPGCSEGGIRKPRAKQARAKVGGADGGVDSVARRKLTNTEVKPPREHLSLKKKRENHNRCEQKRRLLIKEGFDSLCELVPGMYRRTGFNKSTMLSMTAEWLEELLEGNRALVDQLASLEQG